MAVSSVVLFTHLERAKRLDSEYYQPKYLALQDVYKKGQWLPIRKFLSMCEYGLSIKMNEKGDGYKIFRMDDLKNGFALDIEMKYAPITKGEFQKFELLKDDILFNRVNSEEFVGRTGIYKLEGEHVFASYLVRARTNGSMSPDALNLFLNCKYGVMSIRRLSRRAVNQANVNAQELKSILMPCFSFGFQETLTRYSNTSWKLYVESAQKYSQAEELLLTELGLNKWMPDHNLTYVRKYSEISQSQRMDAEHFKPVYDRLLKIVYQNAECKRIGEIRTFNARGSQPIYVESGDLRVINSKHILEQHLDYENLEATSGDFWDEQSTARVFENDILIYTTGANVGRTNVYLDTEKALASNHVNILRLRQENQIYVGFVMNSIVGRMQTRKYITGTAQAELYPSDIDKFAIPFVAKEKQEQIAIWTKESLVAKRKAKELFEKAKRAIELAIEDGEDVAMEFLS